MRTWPLLLLLAACGASKQNKEVCQKASERYLTCVGEVLGPEMRAQAAAKDGTAACARDDKTVAMYRKCLPATTCELFMSCIMDYADGTQPTIAADGSRAEQCAQHVEQGMRSIGNQILMLGEIVKRDNAAKRDVQGCLLDESKPWQNCLTAPELAEAQRYATQRQQDCEAWEPELAACILKQPGATGCNEDEYPLWELPVERGAAGPAIAWTATITDSDDDSREPHIEWAVDKSLIVRDDTGLRSLVDGKQRWHVPLVDADEQFAFAATFIAIRDEGGARGLRILDYRTGAEHGRALAGKQIKRYDAAAAKVLVHLDDDQLYLVSPSVCKGDKPPSSCAHSVGQLNEDDAVSSSRIASIGDRIVMMSSSGIHVVDAKGATVHALELDDANTIIPTADGAAAVYDSRIELYTFVGCARGADCMTTRHAVSWVNTVAPVALPGGGIAYNDHGIVEKTSVVERDGSTWAVKTRGRGDVAGDADHIYTVSFGRSAKEPTKLLALARATGKVVWETELPGAAFDARQASITRRDRQLAVRVGDKLYALTVPTKT